jgi:hypothetical protein
LELKGLESNGKRRRKGPTEIISAFSLHAAVVNLKEGREFPSPLWLKPVAILLSNS